MQDVTRIFLATIDSQIPDIDFTQRPGYTLDNKIKEKTETFFGSQANYLLLGASLGYYTNQLMGFAALRRQTEGKSCLHKQGNLVLTCNTANDIVEAELDHLFVSPEAHGQGVGKALLRHVKSHLSPEQTLVLRCFARNVNAVAFYKSQGFVIDRNERSSFRNNEGEFEDFAVMSLH